MTAVHRPGPWNVLGTGAALPGPALTTEAVLASIDARFGVRLAARGQRLALRLGIASRHFAHDVATVGSGPRPGDSNPELAARAVSDALVAAHLTPSDLTYVLGHTTTPHTLLPSNTAWLADHLGYDGPYAELRQACTGFAHALLLAGGLLQGASGPVAIVGSETGSVFLDPRRAARDIEQLLNLVQMGDGAGAIVLEPDAGAASRHSPPQARLRDAFAGALGHGRTPGFWLESGGSAQPSVGGLPHFRHDAQGVRVHGAELFMACAAAARDAGIRLAEIDWLLPHQANARELPDELAQRLSFPRERILVTGHRVGNLGSASIWVGLHLARTSGQLKPGERVLVLGAEATKYLYGGFVYEHADLA